MIGTLRALAALVGDAMIAAGVVLRDRFDTPIPPDAPYFDDNDVPVAPAIPRDDVQSALNDASDSVLLNIAAHIIAGWKPILLLQPGNATDVDLLVAALTDRAAQFEAAELDAAEQFPINHPEHDFSTGPSPLNP